MSKGNRSGIFSVFVLQLVVVCAAYSCLVSQQITAQTPQTVSIEKAFELFQSQRWEEAVKAFDALTKAEPSNGRAWYGLGLSLYSQNHRQAGAASIGNNGSICDSLFEECKPAKFHYPASRRHGHDGPAFFSAIFVARDNVKNAPLRLANGGRPLLHLRHRLDKPFTGNSGNQE